MFRKWNGDKSSAEVIIERWEHCTWIAWVYLYRPNQPRYQTEIAGGTLNEIRERCEQWITVNLPK